ncbi:MAG: NADH-quinone oxidoreductase subunit NuoF [Acidimicrobiia bacterium]|nr:NADH-quinone oxidoreductase subunit NuoF [Acidimicrobiia bacterium]MBT8194365.1 NADH-quinone oxidoreductase subunit NuoF [Acidimicrobiia bacterium]MBT8247225.1 NADH-quinone oxidoreductase subunit NuoF [Acidimicrobiia bacterium]NNF88395.1 NADH-quinone oxidoreductase subunit NuoF [Acidimicrobiia bacterium]NNJ48617.1 NADH-quinone oxidoreductase subunit NuoF [Acidimicrobiia bacterium]
MKILTARMEAHPSDSQTLERYLATDGYLSARKALTTMTATEVHEEVKASNLRGRGGAGFPCGVKWGFLPPDTRPRYLVINGDESEPGTFKDRQLLERDPHQLIEGIIISAYAIDCHEAFIYIRGEYPRPARRIERALAEAYEAGYLGKDIFGTGFDLEVTLHLGAGAYICGEETALLNSLEGKRGEPRLKPPFPAVEGLYGKPTIVNNVETISNMPWIVANGGAAYAAIGPEGSAGTRLFSLSGHVRKPGNYEIVMGMTFGDFIEDYGGGVRDGRAVKCFIPGGASAPWFTGDQLDLPITIDDVGNAGSMLGSGAIVVMDETTNVVEAAHSIVSFFAHESCGQCTPCREGTSWLEMVLARILRGEGRMIDLDLLLDVSDNIVPGLGWPPKMTTICPLGPSAVSPVTSILRQFRDEVEAMIPAGVPGG